MQKMEKFFFGEGEKVDFFAFDVGLNSDHGGVVHGGTVENGNLLFG